MFQIGSSLNVMFSNPENGSGRVKHDTSDELNGPSSVSNLRSQMSETWRFPIIFCDFMTMNEMG